MEWSSGAHHIMSLSSGTMFEYVLDEILYDDIFVQGSEGPNKESEAFSGDKSLEVINPLFNH